MGGVASGVHRLCENCGADISHKQATARFCSRACAMAVYNDAHGEELRRKARERMKTKRASNPAKQNAYSRQWKRRNKDKVQAYRKAYAEKQGKTYKAKPEPSNKQWAANAKQAWRYWLNEKAPDWWLDHYWQATGKPWNDKRLTEAEKFSLRYRLDEEFAIRQRLRQQIRKKSRRAGIGDSMRNAIKTGGRSKKVESLLGYSISELANHLERQFTKGMNWDRFKSGDIHIDHIIPQSSFDLTNDDEWRKCWCLSNLRPLWARDNIAKSNNVETLL